MAISKRIFFALLICDGNQLLAQGEWDLVAPFPPRLGAYSAVTMGNRAYFWTRNNTVYSTADGGNTFTISQYAPTADVALGSIVYQGLAFTDSLTGFVADVAYGQFKTTDGGKSWEKTLDRANLEGSILVFAGDKIGWRFAGLGFYKTTDGGNIWQYNQVQEWWGGFTGRAFVLDEKRVWVTRGYYSGVIMEGSIWYSSDGGTNWEQLTNAPRSNDSNEIRYSDIQLSPEGIGFAIGTITDRQFAVDGFISRTTDFGKTWETSEFDGEQPKSVLAVGNNTWLVFGNIGDTSYCRRNSNNGISWTLVPNLSTSKGNKYFEAAAYVPNLSCVLTVLADGIYRSFDGGVTFSRLTSDRDIVITDVTVERNHNGTGKPIILSYGPDSSLLISEDDGLTWQRKNIPVPKNSHYAISRARIAGGVIYAMINQMILFKSTDKGDTWSRLYTPNQGGQQGLEVFDANTIAVNGFPFMLSTTNGGDTWLKPPFPGSCWVNEISMVNAKTFFAAGSYSDTSGTRGMFYRTTDAGYNWHIVDLPEEILHICRLSGSLIYAHSVRGVYKSSDGGITWATLRTSNDYYTYYKNFTFRDSLYGILKEAYYFLQTTNGGKSWTPTAFSVPFYMGPDALELTADGRFLAVGEGKLFIQKEPMEGWKISSKEISTPEKIVNYYTVNAYPNPFNPATTISFDIPRYSQIKLSVYDILGRDVAILANGLYAPGHYKAKFDGSNKASGIYFYQLTGDGFSSIKKMLLIR